MFKRYPYIYASLLATLLAVVVWLCMPKEYAAYTKVSDEYKEVDLAVGLNDFQVTLRNVSDPANVGINDIEIYCRILDSEDFARDVSKCQVPGKGITYGQWLIEGRHIFQSADTFALVADKISYNLNTKHQTLGVRVTDREPVVAAQMLDSAINKLQEIITVDRQKNAKALLANFNHNVALLEKACKKAENDYVSYSDAHLNPSSEDIISKKEALEHEYTNYKDKLNNAKISVVRQQYLAERSAFSFATIESNVVPIDDMSHPLALVCVFVLISLAVVKGVKLYKVRKANHDQIEFGGMFSPWSITLLVWAGMAFMFIFSGDILDPITSQFYIAISLWIPIFVITSFVVFNLLKHDSKPLPKDGVEVNKLIFYFFFAVAIVLSPMYMYKVWQVVSAFDSKDMMNNMRVLAIHGDGYGFLNYANAISVSLLLVALWRYPKIPLWQLLAVVLCCLLNSLAEMEKGSIFLVILCSTYVMFERGVIKARTIAVVGVALLIVFYIFNLMREGEESEYSQNESLLDFIGMYVMSPPVAFCRIKQEITSQFGTNTLETFYLFLNRFGIGHFAVHEKTQDFVYVPVTTNVYTIMQPFFRDFGYLGVAFFAWIYGIISGVLYRLSCNGKVLAICLYTFMVQILVLQFYQENLFLSIVPVIQKIFFVALMTQTIITVSITKRKRPINAT